MRSGCRPLVPRVFRSVSCVFAAVVVVVIVVCVFCVNLRSGKEDVRLLEDLARLDEATFKLMVRKGEDITRREEDALR